MVINKWTMKLTNQIYTHPCTLLKSKQNLLVNNGIFMETSLSLFHCLLFNLRKLARHDLKRFGNTIIVGLMKHLDMLIEQQGPQNMLRKLQNAYFS